MSKLIKIFLLFSAILFTIQVVNGAAVTEEDSDDEESGSSAAVTEEDSDTEEGGSSAHAHGRNSHDGEDDDEENSDDDVDDEENSDDDEDDDDDEDEDDDDEDEDDDDDDDDDDEDEDEDEEYLDHVKGTVKKLGLNKKERAFAMERAASWIPIMKSKPALKILYKVYQDIKSIIMDRHAVQTILNVSQIFRNTMIEPTGSKSLITLFEMSSKIMTSLKAHDSLLVFKYMLEDLVQEDNVLIFLKAKTKFVKHFVNYEHFDFVSKELIRFIKIYPKRFEKKKLSQVIMDFTKGMELLFKVTNTPLLRSTSLGCLDGRIIGFQNKIEALEKPKSIKKPETKFQKSTSFQKPGAKFQKSSSTKNPPSTGNEKVTAVQPFAQAAISPKIGTSSKIQKSEVQPSASKQVASNKILQQNLTIQEPVVEASKPANKSSKSRKVIPSVSAPAESPQPLVSASIPPISKRESLRRQAAGNNLGNEPKVSTDKEKPLPKTGRPPRATTSPNPAEVQANTSPPPKLSSKVPATPIRSQKSLKAETSTTSASPTSSNNKKGLVGTPKSPTLPPSGSSNDLTVTPSPSAPATVISRSRSRSRTGTNK